MLDRSHYRASNLNTSIKLLSNPPFYIILHCVIIESFGDLDGAYVDNFTIVVSPGIGVDLTCGNEPLNRTVPSVSRGTNCTVRVVTEIMTLNLEYHIR